MPGYGLIPTIRHWSCFSRHCRVQEKATSISFKTLFTFWSFCASSTHIRAMPVSSVQAKDTQVFSTRWTEINICQSQKMVGQDLILETWHLKVPRWVVLSSLILLAFNKPVIFTEWTPQIFTKLSHSPDTILGLLPLDSESQHFQCVFVCLLRPD